uniref:Uncharacterized protein n=1 Tax=Paramormyrops kingsleyae TaxID=1676925 RepID=A0A3B3TIC8_9TELE
VPLKRRNRGITPPQAPPPVPQASARNDRGGLRSCHGYSSEVLETHFAQQIKQTAAVSLTHMLHATSVMAIQVKELAERSSANVQFLKAWRDLLKGGHHADMPAAPDS